MTDLPSDAKQISGFAEFGLDADGDTMFFGFNLREGGVNRYIVSEKGLAGVIHYLQNIASTAQQRRLMASPIAADMEVQSAQNNPVVTIHFDPDVEGRNALLSGTTANGVPIQAIQLSFDLVEKLHSHLPSLIAEMKGRQTKKGQAH